MRESGGSGTLLVVTGEPSGDLAAARVVRELAQTAHIQGVVAPRVIAVGGDALAAAGAEIRVPIAALSTMGTTEVASRGLALLGAGLRVRNVLVHEAPAAALLVGFSEMNARLGATLRAHGVKSVFYGLPQVWAWRASRACARIADVLCAMLPFEAPLWAAHGHDARFVGHPALEAPRLPRALLRDSLGLPPRAPCIAILPGSRAHEIHRMLDVLLAAFRIHRDAETAVEARILVAPSLDRRTRAFVAERARQHRVELTVVPAGTSAVELLPAFDASLVTSGTATLEAALAGAHPVIAYRASRTTEFAARALLATPHIGLPNIVLGRGAYAEIVGHACTPQRLAHALAETLARHETLSAAAETLRAAFGTATHPSRHVAQILAPWLLHAPRPVAHSATAGSTQRA